MANPAPDAAALAPLPIAPAVTEIDTSFLESLMGYNARRAALTIIEVFLQRMAVLRLRPVDFSVLWLINRHPGITSRQLCTALSILPPNLVGLIKSLEQRQLITRRPHPSDGRATGLHPTEKGQSLAEESATLASELELEVTHRLSDAERKTLMRLLQKIYLR